MIRKVRAWTVPFEEGAHQVSNEALSMFSLIRQSIASNSRLAVTSFATTIAIQQGRNNRSISKMVSKASLKPAEDFIEFVNASPTRMPTPHGRPSGRN